MKITHTKKKGRAWTLTLASEEEAKAFVHFVGCRRSHCNIKSERDNFARELHQRVFDYTLPYDEQMPA